MVNSLYSLKYTGSSYKFYFESVHHTSFILCLRVAKFFIHVPKDCISIEVFYIFDQVPSVISACVMLSVKMGADTVSQDEKNSRSSDNQ